MTITRDNVGFHCESSAAAQKFSLSTGATDHASMGFSNEAFLLSDIGVKEAPSRVREGWFDAHGWKSLEVRNDAHPELEKNFEAWFSREVSEVKDGNLDARIDAFSGIDKKEGRFPRVISSEPITNTESTKTVHPASSSSPVEHGIAEDCSTVSYAKTASVSTRGTIERSSVLGSRNAGALMTDGSSLLFDAVSSVIRDAFLGCFRCFPCSQGQLTCFEEVETEPKGAWFDCKRVQSKDSFCYSNPTINLSEEVATESPSDGPQEFPVDVQADGNVALGRTMPVATRNELQEENTAQSPRQSSLSEIREHNKTDNHDVYRTKESSKMSFALQLEEDHKQRAADLGRSEGRRCEPAGLTSAKFMELIEPSVQNFSFSCRNFDWREMEDEFPGLQESCLELEDFNISHGGGFVGNDVHGDVWEDTELKEAFGIYNLNAFYSYGHCSPIVLSSTPCKPLNEKFDEIFPTKQAVPNTSIEEDFEPASPTAVCAEKTSTKENRMVASQKKWISEEALYNIVRQFLSLEGRDSFARNFRLYKDNLNCDNYFIYNGRRITKRLLFDLVNEKLLCYRERYLHSYPLNVTFIPTEKIEVQVFKVLDNIGSKSREGRKYRMIHDAVKFENDAMVSTVVAENLKCEEWSWTNYAKEEEERKLSVADEILNELLFDTASLFKTLLEKNLKSEVCKL